MISQKALKKELKYDSNTGIFTRLKNTSNCKKGDTAGCERKDGYIVINIKGKLYRGHILAWIYVYGEVPMLHIDHINHNRSDNRIENLRLVTRSDNQKNRSLSKNNKSGVNGVGFYKNRWHARIKVDKKQIHLGTFTEFHEAVNARKNAEVLYGFHKNHGKD